MSRVFTLRQARHPAGARPAGAALAAALPLFAAAALAVLLAAGPATARIGVDEDISDQLNVFASPDPAGLEGGEEEPLPATIHEPPPIGTPSLIDRPLPAGPDERGPASGQRPATPFGVDPNLGIKPPAADVAPDTSPLPDIHYGEADLPEPVRRTREAILEAARGGDIEALRAVLETSEMPPVLARGATGDPITFLKESSGDPEGREILAILTDLLEAGWVTVDAGKPTEMYVWPYFATVPIDRLTPPQMVELYRILTAADVDEMRAYDAWLFFKIGIGPDGTWHYFMVDTP